jgi:isopentenyl diphosphate isomerase/L-lactate dehydrogenase-like FMN-dependent dehydrogenase
MAKPTVDERLRKAWMNVADMRAEARRVLPRAVFDFADGGAEDERTLRRNESAFDEITLLPRPLNGAAERDLSVELFGRRHSLPLMIGPTGIAGLIWPDGEAAAARAASKAGVVYCLSHGSVCTVEHLAATGAEPRWMQVFIYRDRGFTRELAARAEAAGYEALVLTVDNQLTGNRERDLRNGFTIPPSFRWADRLAMATKGRWLWRMRRELPRVTFGNYVRPDLPSDAASVARRMTAMLDPSMSWQDVKMLRKAWKGPLLLKGILHPAEARKALEYGVDAIIVSNHGGRQLDGAASSIEALPAIVEAVAGGAPVLVDGGIRRGVDVVKALALGAASCLIARPQLWGLAIGGEAGVSHVLELFRREIDRAMGLMGAARVADLSRDMIVFRGFDPDQRGSNHAKFSYR